MSDKKSPEALDHPEHGRIPAHTLLQCVFALSPDGPILHQHIEEMDVAEDSAVVIYTPNGKSPLPERSRCQIIPPRVTQFPVLG